MLLASWTSLLSACVILHFRICVGTKNISKQNTTVKEIFTKYTPHRKTKQIKYQVVPSASAVVEDAFVPTSRSFATAPVITSSDPAAACRNRPCQSPAKTSNHRKLQRKISTRDNKDEGLLGSLFSPLGHTEKFVNVLTRRWFPHLAKHVHKIWSSPLQALVRRAVKRLTSPLAHHENCAVLVDSIDKQVPMLGSFRIANMTICGLNQINREFMKKSFHTKYWLFDTFVHFKNATVSFGTVETKLAVPVPLLRNLNVSGLKVILEDITFHMYFSVPVGILPVISGWSLKVDHPEGFKVEFGEDAGIVQKMLAAALTNMVWPVLKHPEFLFDFLNSLAASAIGHLG